jgi:hypothetical protein
VNPDFANARRRKCLEKASNEMLRDISLFSFTAHFTPLANAQTLRGISYDPSATSGSARKIKDLLAEGVGFEPTLRFPVNTLSKRAP